MKIGNTAPATRVMVVAVMVSMVAFLDSTVLNLALPATTRDLGGGMGLQQWVVHVSVVLFIVGAVVCAVTITNPVTPAEPVPCEVAALCRDRAGAQPPLPAAAAKRPTRETSRSRAVSFTRVIGGAG